MLDPRKINDAVQQVIDSLPSGLKNMPREVEENFRRTLTATFNRLDLVTREEFDTQTKVLQRTRTKLEALEAQVTMLENQLNKK